MEEAESEKEFLVFEVALAAREGGLVYHLVESFHVGFQTLGEGGGGEWGERERVCEKDEVLYICMYIHNTERKTV